MGDTIVWKKDQKFHSSRWSSSAWELELERERERERERVCLMIIKKRVKYDSGH